MTESQSKKKFDQRQVFLSRYQEIFPTSPVWGQVEYMLQTSYTNVSLVLNRLYIIGNKTLESKFIATNENKKMIDIILSESELSEKSEDFPSICDKGFKEILNIQYGKMEMNKLNKEYDNFYEVMICKAAIGKTYIYPIKNVADSVPYDEKPQLMTDDFDSVLIYDDTVNTKEFRQNMIIYDSQTKCLPQYIAHFKFDPLRYKELQGKIMCELCDDNIAQKYCEMEDVCLCSTCDKSHHANKLGSKHIRTQLAQKPKNLGSCPKHPSLKLQLFCLECNQPLCINCKVKGDHSSGQMIMHTLIRINEKYQDIKKIISEPDINLEKKKQNLNQNIRIIQGKLKEINKKNTQIQDKIYETVQNSLKQLEKLTKKKMALLMSDHLELKRQLDTILWMQTFMRYQIEVLSPNDFLLSFARYEIKKKDILSEKFELTKVLPDMRIEGYLTVLTEEESRRGKKVHQSIISEDKSPGIFHKGGGSKNQHIMKIKKPWEEPIQEGKQQIVKSRNNLLNLSILKNI